MQGALNSIIDLLLYTLTPIHYFAFLISFFIWIFFLIITFAVRKKRILFIFFTLLSTLLFFTAPIISYFSVELKAKEREISDVEIKQLTFTDKVIVKGTLENRSNRSLKKCRIFSFAVPKNASFVNRTKNMINPRHYSQTSFDYDLKPSKSEKFYITLNKIKNRDEFDIYNFSFCK